MNAIATRWASAEETMRRLAMTVLGALAVAAALIFAAPAHAQNAQAQPSPFGLEEVVAAGHGFFGSTSGAIATAIERAFSMYGLPNGYILGQEAGGAFVGGLTYGEGTLYTKNAGDHSVFWQGPSLGWDFGGEGARTMMLVYHLPSVDNLQGRYGGVAGSAYLVAGVGMHVLKRNNVLLVPVRTGVGARLVALVQDLQRVRAGIAHLPDHDAPARIVKRRVQPGGQVAHLAGPEEHRLRRGRIGLEEHGHRERQPAQYPAQRCDRRARPIRLDHRDLPVRHPRRLGELSLRVEARDPAAGRGLLWRRGFRGYVGDQLLVRASGPRGYLRTGVQGQARVISAYSPVTGLSYVMSCGPEGGVVACRQASGVLRETAAQERLHHPFQRVPEAQHRRHRTEGLHARRLRLLGQGVQVVGTDAVRKG